MNKAALFDLDGVIIDTEGKYSQFWGGMGREYESGYDDFADRIKGTTLVEILDNYFPASKHEEIVTRLMEFEDNMTYEIFPDALAFLDELKAAGIKCALVTSSGEKKLARLWAQQPHLKGYFDAVISDADVAKSKPDPEGYILAAKTLGCDPADSYVFEDSYNGLLAGRRSGAKVIALSTTNPAETLYDKADLVIPGFSHLNAAKLLAI